jgi:hypothetical protein
VVVLSSGTGTEIVYEQFDEFVNTYVPTVDGIPE